MGEIRPIKPEFSWSIAAGKGLRHALVTLGSVAGVAVLAYMSDAKNVTAAFEQIPGWSGILALTIAGIAGTLYDRIKRS